MSESSGIKKLCVWAVGLSHKTTPIGLREKFAITESAYHAFNAFLKNHPHAGEQVVLSTCNRVEIYGAGTDQDESTRHAIEALKNHAGLEDDAFAPHLYLLRGEEAVRHLFGVAAGLDSLALGETEILGQVKTAYLKAHQAGHTGRILNPVFQKALSTAKKVRTQTAIGAGRVSVASIAVDLARKIFFGLKDKTVLLIGSGEVARQVCEALSKDGVSKLWIVNRHRERAEALAAEFSAEALPFEEIDARAGEADIVLSSAGSPRAFIHRDRVELWRKSRRRRALFLVDLGVPRNIEDGVAGLGDVYLYNLDDLTAIAGENRKARGEAAERGRLMIGEAVEYLAKKIVLGPSGGVLPEFNKELECESLRSEKLSK